MPIFRYFLFAGPLLLGLIFLLDNQLPPPSGRLPNSTNFAGLRLAHSQPKIEHLTISSAPHPDMSSAAVLAAEPPPVAAAPSAPVAPQSLAKAAPQPKKAKRTARRHNARNVYAEAYPWGWRPQRSTRFW